MGHEMTRIDPAKPRHPAAPPPVTAVEAACPESERVLIGDLCPTLEAYLEPQHVRAIYRAYLFGAQAHLGQTRRTGEAYISHPLAVAQILAQMRMDHASIMAAILHDVIEDTPVGREQVAAEFGEDVAALVDGVTKLSRMKFRSRAQAQAENFLKMVLAMSRDIRVILVKLADRLHNMRTLGSLPTAKRKRIAKETLDIYVPMAHRLGINSFRIELEDRCFEILYPMRARVLRNVVGRSAGRRREWREEMETTIAERMHAESIPARVAGREKHLYGLYQKMRAKHVPPSEIYDMFAIRVVVERIDQCYRALGVLHNLYKPRPGRFKDFIAIPKSNGYQSLHTVVMSPKAVPVEIQIRTEDMDRFAEQGIAAHWLYKSDESGTRRAQARVHGWLQGLLELQQRAGDSEEFLENVKIDLFPDEVYVFTPRGEILKLPQGATALDFAYAVHTDVGNHCAEVRIDRQYQPLSAVLRSGQSVEVKTAEAASPKPWWLGFVATGKARAHIRHYLKGLPEESLKALGQQALDRALRSVGCGPSPGLEHALHAFMEAEGYANLDELRLDLGRGRRMAHFIAKQIQTEEAPEAGEGAEPARVADATAVPSRHPLIRGVDGLAVRYARCCHPIPGDRILGFLSAGKGVVIHRARCPNVSGSGKRPPNGSRGSSTAPVQWTRPFEAEPVLTAAIQVRVTNRRGVLARLAAIIAKEGSNIDDVRLVEREGGQTLLIFVLSVADRTHLARIFRRLRHNEYVHRVWRSGPS
jgi:RelA/SpoT family (p)ppGpp synthetase